MTVVNEIERAMLETLKNIGGVLEALHSTDEDRVLSVLAEKKLVDIQRATGSNHVRYALNGDGESVLEFIEELKAGPAKKRQITVDADLYDRLKAAADERVLSVRLLARFLLEDGLEHLIPADEIRLTRQPTAVEQPEGEDDEE